VAELAGYRGGGGGGGTEDQKSRDRGFDGRRGEEPGEGARRGETPGQGVEGPRRARSAKRKEVEWGRPERDELLGRAI